MGHFKKLKAWQHARALALVSKPLIARLPDVEGSGLGDQWRRAASSVVLNIAEGASRHGNKEFRKHLGIARASLDEVEAIIDLAVGLDYLRREDVTKAEAVPLRNFAVCATSLVPSGWLLATPLGAAEGVALPPVTPPASL